MDEQERMSDDISSSAKQTADAIKKLSQHSASQAAGATANAAAAAVKAGVEGGKAVSEIAAGTAAGGPAGAVVAALWASRNALVKILSCIGLLMLMVIILVCSLPSVVTNSVFGLDGKKPAENATLANSYEALDKSVASAVQSGYQYAKDHVEALITEGGYDYDLSMDALVDNASGTAAYDTCYVLACYSAAMEQKDTSAEDMTAKLLSVTGDMFPVETEEQTIEEIIPVHYTVYHPVTITEVTASYLTGYVDDNPIIAYETYQRTVYLPGDEEESYEAVTIPTYTESVYTVPTYSGGAIIGTHLETYYDYAGDTTLTPDINIIHFLVCTIHPFNAQVIQAAFGLDLAAPYSNLGITTGEAITNMTIALKMTLYGQLGTGMVVPLTDAQMVAFLSKQQCSPTRKQILATALSLVGKVPYFWGGKSPAGWNDRWNTPVLVTSAGSVTTGTMRPYGLDCSGFSDWVYRTALGVSLEVNRQDQLSNSVPISPAELRPGDLGFIRTGTSTGWSHVMIFAGWGDNGEWMWVHATPDWVVLNSPSYPLGNGEDQLDLRRPTVTVLD